METARFVHTQYQAARIDMDGKGMTLHHSPPPVKGRTSIIVIKQDAVPPPIPAKPEQPKAALVNTDNSFLMQDDIAEARKYASGYDIYYLAERWKEFVANNNIQVKSKRNHFIDFVKKYVKKNRL